MPDPLAPLTAQFGEKLLRSAGLSRYTTARIGGPADGLLVAENTADLIQVLQTVWSADIPYRLIGEGSNLLISDAGFRGLIIINRTSEIEYNLDGSTPLVTADSGINLVTLARLLAEHGLSGFEWAGGIPGTLGGAVYGNAGAHGADIASLLESASILHRNGDVETWPCARFAYGYRISILKSASAPAVILRATLRLSRKPQEEIRAAMTELNSRRRAAQPAGASLGSIFKNPPGDHAGRLIEAAGLKGYTIGGAAVSEKHANFFINTGGASASDYHNLIRYVRAEVQRKFGIELETEIEMIGNFTQEMHHG
jgi:UDP-N-acetylmuramate dehydrogenase